MILRPRVDVSLCVAPLATCLLSYSFTKQVLKQLDLSRNWEEARGHYPLPMEHAGKSDKGRHTSAS